MSDAVDPVELKIQRAKFHARLADIADGAKARKERREMVRSWSDPSQVRGGGGLLSNVVVSRGGVYHGERV